MNPHSPHYVAAVFEHDIGIRLNDKERKGLSLLIKLKGKVEVFYRQARRDSETVLLNTWPRIAAET